MILRHDIGFGSVAHYVCDCGLDMANVKIITDILPVISIDKRRGFSKPEKENYDTVAK